MKRKTMKLYWRIHKLIFGIRKVECGRPVPLQAKINSGMC